MPPGPTATRTATASTSSDAAIATTSARRERDLGGPEEEEEEEEASALPFLLAAAAAGAGGAVASGGDRTARAREGAGRRQLVGRSVGLVCARRELRGGFRGVGDAGRCFRARLGGDDPGRWLHV